MSCMFEIYYKVPPDLRREAALTNRVAGAGGRLSFREEPADHEEGSICLTFEFDDRTKAEAAVESLRRLGEHVEGPQDYGA